MRAAKSGEPGIHTSQHEILRLKQGLAEQSESTLDTLAEQFKRKLQWRKNLRGQALYPDAGRRWFAQVHRMSTRAHGHRLVILALQHFHLRRRQQPQAFQKFQEPL